MIEAELKMAKSSSKSINRIVEEAMPGWQTISTASDALTERLETAAPADQIGKDASQLRKAYGKGSSAAADAGNSKAANIKFVRIASKTPTDAQVGTKTVVVDTKAGKILGVQG